MSAALRKMLQSDEKRKQLTKALLENDLRRKNPELVPEGQTALPTLKLAVNADSLSTWFMDAMATFTQDGNELLDISIDDQDHTAKRIKEGEVMAAVTATGVPKPAAPSKKAPKEKAISSSWMRRSSVMPESESCSTLKLPFCSVS